jgi:fatty acid desaturase
MILATDAATRVQQRSARRARGTGRRSDPAAGPQPARPESSSRRGCAKLPAWSFHRTLLAGTVAVLVLAVLFATIGAPMAVCLVLLMLAPLVTVIGYETIGHRHMLIAVQRTLASH